jgi:hypothetical protein
MKKRNKTIKWPDHLRITIVEVKRLILEALAEPVEESDITNAILDAKREGKINPRVTFNPAFTDYRGIEMDDSIFAINRGDFEVIAKLFKCKVA